jgi:hypothetical protein
MNSKKKLLFEFSVLKKMKYSKNTTVLRKFKNQTDVVEKLIKKCKRECGLPVYKVSSPLSNTYRLMKIFKKFHKQPCMSKKGMVFIKRTGKKITIITKPKFILNSINRCKDKNKKHIVVPISIKNTITGKKHLNLLILNPNRKYVWRIDPSYQFFKNKVFLKKHIRVFFEELGYKYKGFYPRRTHLRHGKLCKYAAAAEYLFGKSLTHKKLKKIIISYLHSEILKIKKYC